jgi:hypothetical protein
MSLRVLKFLTFTVLGALGPVALGQGVNPDTSPTDTSHILTLFSSGEGGQSGGWRTVIGTPSDPVFVELDPTGPVWLKHLTTQDDAPISYYGQVVRLEENLLVGGSLPWTGWHSQADTEGFRSHYWTPLWPPYQAVPAFTIRADGSNVPADISMSNTGYDITFPALQPGTNVTIIQEFVWSDQAMPFTGTIQMHQYPTPEPATLAFTALTGLFITRRRSR